jgi:hypothetical protein
MLMILLYKLCGKNSVLTLSCKAQKSPFSKGGFIIRGIIKRFYNPPCPPLEKGGSKPWI